jgi:tRNA(adenine34) deaminase
MHRQLIEKKRYRFDVFSKIIELLIVQSQIGAIVVNEKGIVLSTGRSKMESQRDSNAQAEVISISLAQSILKSNSLKNCSLYTTLEPCGNIMTLIKESNLRSVSYGAQDNENGAFHGRSNLDKELLETGFSQIDFVDGLLETDSTNLLDSFFRARKREAPDQILLSYRGFRPKLSPGS